MNSHFSRRRTHGFVDDPSEQGLDNTSLIPPFQPFTYSAAPPSSSFNYPTATTQSSFPPEEQVLSTAVAFHGISSQDTADFSQQYQQHQQPFSDPPPQHYTIYHHQATQQQQQQQQQHQQHQHQHQQRQYYSQSSSRKRQRVDSNMHLPLFQRPFGHGGQERSPGSEYPESEVDSPGTTTMFHQLGNLCCQPWSGYNTPSVYQPISSTSMYEGPVTRAYSADLDSPSHNQVPPHPAITSSGAEQPGFPVLHDASHSEQQLQEKYPVLQPVNYLSTQPPVSQEPMGYQPFNMQPGIPKSETSPTFMKPEGVEHDYLPINLHVSPTAAPHTVETDYSNTGMVEPKSGSYAHHDMVRYQGQQRYHLSHGYGPSEGVQSEHFDYFPLASQGSGVELAPPNHKPQVTKRGPFKDPQKRAKTAQVRKIGSCIRCRMQRIRCEFDPDSPSDSTAPCDGCKKIVANSKVHRMPCKRWKLTDIKLSKPGQVDEPDLQWTHRWQDSTTLPEITQWANADIKEIRLTDGYGKAIVVKVRRFKELPSDKKRRFIRHDDGTEETIPTEPFGLVDVEAVKTEYEQYLKLGIAQICKVLCGPREKLLWRTYQIAWERRDRSGIEADERALLSRTLDLWMAVRLTTKSFEIIGNETLGIPPDKTGKIVLPPVMGAQLDKIIIDHILPKLRRETLETLQTMTQQKKQKTWLTTYLVTFMLLHNVALITKHDRNYAKKHKMKENYGKEWARAHMVQEYHLGANILLAYFHYCNKGLMPFSKECKDSDLKSLAELDDVSIEFVKWTRDYVENHKRDWEYLRKSNRPEDYGDDYFFVSQLFEHNWVPRDTTVIG